ncbi:hypothetical protein GCM10010112_28300 [Actinoplanes lobatus]|uniref:DUF402 domain-containing protein n=2 Tax=Actinoplanes lobatus TaxID=113568 RepID=A0A7W7HQ08_9ACTN|nr:hypothetical protein [Actinoplanes lobatus]GGN66171.1 hypothetical protein GCM10010112_28300 [Actinoplanes lobatus]GIE45925.1 hypothetical protein Alo02nite_88230 [Actinoplanes lobatus]
MIRMRFTKWGGRLHWFYPLEPLGEDRHGRWFGARAGTPVQRGDEPPVVQGHDVVTLIPATGCWIGSFNPDHVELSAYIDVTTRPEIIDGVIHAVDLDLDVIRRRDGSVAVLDEDEFADHQVRYGYPAPVVAQARATTDDLVGLLTTAVQPFETEARRRLAAFSR